MNHTHFAKLKACSESIKIYFSPLKKNGKSKYGGIALKVLKHKSNNSRVSTTLSGLYKLQILKI